MKWKSHLKKWSNPNFLKTHSILYVLGFNGTEDCLVLPPQPQLQVQLLLMMKKMMMKKKDQAPVILGTQAASIIGREGEQLGAGENWLGINFNAGGLP